MRRLITICLLTLIPLCATFAGLERPRGPVRTLDDPNVQYYVQHGGNVWMTFTNNATSGLVDVAPPAVHDPCQGWAPSCEFPGGSDQQYLFQTGLWIGAKIIDHGFETKRVSVGTDGWLNPSINEFWPAEGSTGAIYEQSNRRGKLDCNGNPVFDPSALAPEEYLATFSDTLTAMPWVESDPVDGSHRPLGIQVRQISREWSSPSFGDFIIVEEHIRNISSNFLTQLCIGLYMDADVGLFSTRISKRTTSPVFTPMTSPQVTRSTWPTSPTTTGGIRPSRAARCSIRM